MVRQGVMSDISIREQYPEMFPLSLGFQQALYAPNLTKPKMNKASKKVKHATDYARMPIYDIKNFARLSTPQNATIAGFQGVLNYRKKIGSSNVPANLQLGYEEQKEQVYTMRVPKATTKTIFEFSPKRAESILQFNEKFPMQRVYLDPRTKAMLMNLGSDEEIQRVMENTLPKPLKGKYEHEHALALLERKYDNSPEDIAVLRRAEQESRSRTFDQELDELMADAETPPVTPRPRPLLNPDDRY